METLSGAVKSGFARPSAVGPRELCGDSGPVVYCLWSIAPTVTTAATFPGARIELAAIAGERP